MNTDRLILASSTILLGFVFMALVLATAYPAKAEQPDYELIANCIAEFDYTHPDQPMMDNLVIALEECQR